MPAARFGMARKFAPFLIILHKNRLQFPAIQSPISMRHPDNFLYHLIWNFSENHPLFLKLTKLPLQENFGIILLTFVLKKAIFLSRKQQRRHHCAIDNPLPWEVEFILHSFREVILSHFAAKMPCSKNSVEQLAWANTVELS